MAAILQFPSREEREYRALSTVERAFVEHLLKIKPDYRYQAAGLPLKSAPGPGLASAIAAAKIMRARWEFGAAG